MNDKDELKKMLVELNAKKKCIAELAKEEEDFDAAYKSSYEYLQSARLIAKINAVSREVDILSTNIRERALRLSAYTDYADRKPVDGVEIKHFENIVTITDNDAAKKWFADNAPDALEIKKSVANKILPHLSFPWCSKYSEYRAQISGDLSVYDEQEETIF